MRIIQAAQDAPDCGRQKRKGHMMCGALRSSDSPATFGERLAHQPKTR